MASRPTWRGYLKLSLVTCPVAMLPATSEAEYLLSAGSADCVPANRPTDD
jgi:non-homologous end joining protein Ku